MVGKINRISNNKTWILLFAVLFIFISPKKIFSSPPEKRSSTIQLAFYKKSDLSKTAVAFVKGKNAEGKFFPVRNINVNFYVQVKDEIKLLTSSQTDVAGKATIDLPKDLPLDESGHFTIVAKIESDSAYDDADEQIQYKDASFSIRLDASNCSHLVTATLTEEDKDGKQVPVKDAEIKFYLQRLFGVMPAAEENTVSTDENGKAEFTYPNDMKGNEVGNVVLVARIEDNESYGNIECQAETNWGIPLAFDKNPFPRALWEPYAPFPLIITISTLFGGVWFTYSYVFNQMRKIKREGQLEKSKKA